MAEAAETARDGGLFMEEGGLGRDVVCNASCIGRPRVLSERTVREIYGAALRVAETAGMRVTHPAALNLLSSAGCTMRDGLVYIPPRLVESARRTVPPRITMWDRNGEKVAMELGGYNSYFGTGSDLLQTWDLESQTLRESTLYDVARAARLVDALPNIDFVMSCAYANDIEPHVSFLREFQAMMLNSEKPLVITAEGVEDTAIMYEIACALRGSAAALEEKPYFVVYNEPVSPLKHSDEAMGKLLFSAERGLPAAYVPAPLAGGTGPITIAGQLSLGLAEYFVGMVVHQLVRPGAPLIFGVAPLVLDLTTMQASYAAIEVSIAHTATVEIARWLDQPNWGYAGFTDAHCLDAQAGVELAQITLLDMLAGSNLSHDVGYQSFGLVASLEQVVVTDEVVSMNRRLLAGIDVDRDTLAVDVIAAVGADGDFVGHKHTKRHCRTAQWRPSVLNRATRESWEGSGSPDLREEARRKALAILTTHKVPELPAEVVEIAEKLITEYGSRWESR
jgi:trimethylamine--corrinoid protein Co-methyltransferase